MLVLYSFTKAIVVSYTFIFFVLLITLSPSISLTNRHCHHQMITLTVFALCASNFKLTASNLQYRSHSRYMQSLLSVLQQMLASCIRGVSTFTKPSCLSLVCYASMKCCHTSDSDTGMCLGPEYVIEIPRTV